jgi:hypothetical protein
MTQIRVRDQARSAKKEAKVVHNMKDNLYFETVGFIILGTRGSIQHHEKNNVSTYSFVARSKGSRL